VGVGLFGVDGVATGSGTAGIGVSGVATTSPGGGVTVGAGSTIVGTPRNGEGEAVGAPEVETGWTIRITGPGRSAGSASLGGVDSIPSRTSAGTFRDAAEPATTRVPTITWLQVGLMFSPSLADTYFEHYRQSEGEP
jgi:hypothetical protein